jgi:hypothetical protein
VFNAELLARLFMPPAASDGHGVSSVAGRCTGAPNPFSTRGTSCKQDSTRRNGCIPISSIHANIMFRQLDALFCKIVDRPRRVATRY